MIITFDWLKENNACKEGLKWFGLKDRDAKEVIESLISDHTKNSDALQWANWTITKILDRTDKIRYAVFAAEQVLDIFEKKYPNDPRPRNAINAAKKVIEADIEENRNAAAADAAAYAAYAAVAADAAADAAYAAAAAAAADAAAGFEAREAEKAWQSNRMLAYLDRRVKP